MTLNSILGITNLRFRNVQSGLVYGLALLVIGLDQVSKYSIEQNLGPYGSGKTFSVGGGLIFRYSKNNGASNNILENTSWLLAIVAALAALAMIIYYHRMVPKSRLQQAGIGLLLGGTLGNLYDRIFKDGFVTDFIHIEWLPGAKNFNLADMGIRASLAIFILIILMHLLRSERNQKVV